MALALAFLPQAIAQAVALALSQVHWVLSPWARVHSVGQDPTLPCAWITAVAPLALQRVTHGSHPIMEVTRRRMHWTGM